MKHILLIAICSLALNFGYAQDTISVDGKTYTSVDTTVLTAKEVYGDVKDGIAGLAKALKAPAEHVYGILVKQQIVYSCIYTIMGILAVILCLSFFKALKSSEKWSTGDDANLLGVVRVVQGVAGMVIFIYFLTCVGDVVTGFINPEYGAVRDIFKFIKGQ